jgi:hypothetical protein
MPGRHDPRAHVHVRTQVALLCQLRRARMEANPDPDRTVGESFRCYSRRRERAACGREGNQEGIALRVDLDAAVGPERLAHDAAVLRQRLPVSVGAKLMQKLRGALHVREEKGDGSHREITRNVVIMRHTADSRHEGSDAPRKWNRPCLWRSGPPLQQRRDLNEPIRVGLARPGNRPRRLLARIPWSHGRIRALRRMAPRDLDARERLLVQVQRVVTRGQVAVTVVR